MYSKSLSLIIAILFIGVLPVFADSDKSISSTVVGNGIGIGSALAIAICWSRTHSVITTILAGILSWFYVIYYCIIREND